MMSDLSDFQRGQIVDVWLAGVTMTETANCLQYTRYTVSKVMSTYFFIFCKKGTAVANRN